jgi:hypothetical protein
MKYFIKVFSLFFFLFLFVNLANSQISVARRPFTDFANIKSTVPTVTMQSFDISKLIAEDAIESQAKDIPPRFGKDLPVNFGYSNSGIKTVLSDGAKIWRLKIKSQGAYSINLIFDKFYLPEGSSFYVYNNGKRQIIGAFTEQNNSFDGKFSTTPVAGDEITLEYNAPPDIKEEPIINVSTVIHAYKNVFHMIEQLTDDYGGSGTCNRNVVCPEGDPYRNQIRSEIMILNASNTRICSGAMINNTRNDGTPFMLTANHCYDASYATWIIMFKYESALCPNNSGDGPTTFTISGTSLMAKNSYSDFCLLKLSSKPPVSYNAYYAGWNRSNVPPTSGYCVHQPDCDVKKISFITTPFTPTSYNNPAIPGDSTHWHVNWAQIPSTGLTAITEPGSSGSPLFDQNNRITGQLHGGPSSCTATDKSDYYGKFSTSWNYGTTSATRLRDWLDSANTGVYVINGFDPNAGPLNAFNVQTPAAGTTITSIAGSTTTVTFNWDTSTAAASYKWIFGSSLPTRQLTIPVAIKPLTMTLSQLDNYLASIGLNQGDSISGSWDVWAFRNNAPANDSLKAVNGPRTIKFKRYKPALTAFSLVSPTTGYRFETMPGGTATFLANWSKSAQGATYKVFYATPNFSNSTYIKLRLPSDNTGYDSTYSNTSGGLDAILASLGLASGDSTVGQWRVYAYSGTDSVASSQTFNITFKRIPITTIVIGTGTTAIEYPYYTLWHDARTQMIYTKSEILAAGGYGNLITGMALNVVSIGSPNMSSFRVRMKNTPDSVITAMDNTTTGWVTCYTNASYIPAGTGWQGYTFSTPFPYSISSNLLVEICYDNSSYSTSTKVNSSSTPQQRTFCTYQDGAAGCSSPTMTYTVTNPTRPNIQLTLDRSTNLQNNLTGIPKEFALYQNYPNPFNPVTKIRYDLPISGFATVKVYDVLGKVVATLVNEQKNAGRYIVDFDGSNLSSGVYFFKYQVANFVQTKRMILLK